MKVLITGAAGFCGSYLSEILASQGAEVIGLEPPGANLANLQQMKGKIEILQADIRDVERLQTVLNRVQPDRVVHLAAVTQLPKDGDHHPMYSINVQGSLNILDSMLKLNLNCPFLLVGSGAQYGPPFPGEVPIRETNVCRPITHYAVTKAMQDLLGYSYWRQGIPVVRTRAFNIIGPRQSPTFVSSSIAKQIAEIEAGLKEPFIDVGNTDTERDFIDVRDVVRAYILALEEGQPGEAYNIGSGKATSIRQVIETLLSLSPMRSIVIHQDPGRVREVDVPTQVADSSKLKDQTGWEPQISLEQSLEDTLAYWRSNIQGMSH